jgi:hypothetical protein
LFKVYFITLQNISWKNLKNQAKSIDLKPIQEGKLTPSNPLSAVGKKSKG